MTTWSERVVKALQTLERQALKDNGALQTVWDQLYDPRALRDGERLEMNNGKIRHFYKDKLDFTVRCKDDWIFLEAAGTTEEKFGDLEKALDAMAHLTASVVRTWEATERSHLSKREMAS